MKVAIIQPNFFPHKVYYDLADRVDKFIFLDDTPFNNKSWLNKTVMKINRKNYYFRIPIEDYPTNTLTKNVNTKSDKWKKKFFKILKIQYKHTAVNYDFVIPILEEIINIPTECFAHTASYSVFRISHSILKSKAKFSFSSTNYEKVKKPYYDKILHICKKEKATTLYTFSGNKGKFNQNNFFKNDIKISYFTSYSGTFSIIDDLMTNYSYRDILRKECNLLQDETK